MSPLDVNDFSNYNYAICLSLVNIPSRQKIYTRWDFLLQYLLYLISHTCRHSSITTLSAARAIVRFCFSVSKKKKRPLLPLNTNCTQLGSFTWKFWWDLRTSHLKVCSSHLPWCKNFKWISENNSIMPEKGMQRALLTVLVCSLNLVLNTCSLQWCTSCSRNAKPNFLRPVQQVFSSARQVSMITHKEIWTE